jgi:hypothetical protein
VISPAARQGVLATNRCAPSGATGLPPWDRARSRARPRSSAGFAERDYSGTQAVKALREESELDRPARGCPELEGVSHWVGTPETGRINRGHRHAALRIGLGVERDHSRRRASVSAASMSRSTRIALFENTQKLTPPGPTVARAARSYPGSSPLSRGLGTWRSPRPAPAVIAHSAGGHGRRCAGPRPRWPRGGTDCACSRRRACRRPRCPRAGPRTSRRRRRP